MGLQTFPDSEIDDADVTFSDRVFHSRAAATGKAHRRWLNNNVRRTTSDDVEAERRR